MDSAIVESLFIDYIFQTDNSQYLEAKEKFTQEIKAYIKDFTVEDFQSLIDTFFDEWKAEDIDFDYIATMAKQVHKYTQGIDKLVNTYAVSFQYDQMDIIDQALFLLGFIERKALATPKEVLINELIELSKRYSDEGSSKLINGIMHHIIANN